MLFDMDFKHKIIQWNCRGLKTKFEEICVLQQEENPSVFCLQETFLKTVDNISLKGFNSYHHIHTDCQPPSLLTALPWFGGLIRTGDFIFE